MTPDAGDAPRAAPRARRAGSGLRSWLTSRPLRTRLLAILVVALLTALAVSGWTAQSLLRGYLLNRVDVDLRNEAARATGFAYERLNGGDEFFGMPNGRAGVPGGYVVRIWTSTQDAVTYPDAAALGESAPAFRTYQGLLVGQKLFTVRSVDGGTTYRVFAATFRDPRNGVTLSSQVAYPLSQVERTLAQLRLLLLGLGMIVVALVALGGWLAIRRAFRPLVEVEETAAVIAAGDLSRRIPERPATTEVGRLTASLNTMLSHIETAFRAREASEARTRRFAADASHELRTPLAAIRGFAELYRQGAVPTDEVPRTMRRIEDEATRMGGLVEDLLLLARLDEQRPGRSEPVDLTVLAADAVHDARGLDAGRPVSLVGLRPGGGPQPALVVGDEDRLRQVVANLVANAVRHTPAGTAVEVAVGTEPAPAGQPFPALAVLEVRDHGPGLAPEQAERIFERFYRVDSSRWRGKGGGSGLGLSIVHAVVTAHSGQVGVRTTPGGGATFRVALPGASVDPSPASD